jgi:parallel beta-helix repeat protein
MANTISSNNQNGISLISGEKYIIDGNTIDSNGGNGIYLKGSKHNIISDNIIDSNNISGISLVSNYAHPITFPSTYNKIFGNTISNSRNGLVLGYSYGNSITDNLITLNNENGIHCSYYDNSIDSNTISNNWRGISIETSECTITDNTISNNEEGIYLSGGNNIIQKNNFLNNTIHAYFRYYFAIIIEVAPFIHKSVKDNWKQNYWGEEQGSPKKIPGEILFGWGGIFIIYVFPIPLPWFNFDWHPAQEPYDIQVGI